MASQKLTQLDLVTSINNADLFYIVQDVGTVATSFGVTFQLLSSTIGGGGGSGGLTLVEHKSITANSTDVTFSGLNGDTDGVYLLTGKIKNVSGSLAGYFLQPNNATTNLDIVYSLVNGGGASQGNSATGYIGGADNNTLFNFDLTLFARKVQNSIALNRTWIAHANNTQSASRAVTNTSGQWSETSTNITSLVVHSDQTNGIGDGSELWLYKYAQ